MSTALAAPPLANQWESREMVETLKQTVCKGATDAQFRMFIEVCKATGLNPFLKEIWYVPSVGVMAARDGYLRVANDHPQFDGMETRVERDERNVPIKATCTVWRKDRNHPVICEAFYSEYKKGGNVWSTYPSAMISKVAEVLALKRSFAINGVVTQEEIGGDDGPPQETQADVLARKLKPTIVEAPKAIEAAPDPNYEERHAALVNEAAAILDEPPAKSEAATPARKRGAISFEALKDWGVMKKAILAATGTTDGYYAALKEAGYSHADEIKTEKEAKVIWKALKRLRDDGELRKGIEAHALRIGPAAFAQVLGVVGFSDFDEFMANANGQQVDSLLRELEAQKVAQ
jgi:phage recombination protein Bet